MTAPDIALFALNASHELGEQVAASLGVPLAPHEERDFEDGEHKIRPGESVRGRDVYLLASLYSDERWPASEKLVRSLFLAAALRDASARSVTAILPYLAYARKDRRTQPRDPVTTRYVAQLIEAVGIDRVVTVEVHNPAAWDNAFRIPAEHLVADRLFVDYLCTTLPVGEPLAVVSPDAGGVKRADRFRDRLQRATGTEVASAMMQKTRALGVMTAGSVYGDIAGRTAIIFDDLISTGGTLARCAESCRQLGSTHVIAVATHGLFVRGANEALANDALDQVIVTNTVPPRLLDPALRARKLVVLPIAPLLAAVIKRVHEGGSLVDLLAQSGGL
jgi:ribose-phosphate pyrophosphokinase